jgi:hypothetical protein
MRTERNYTITFTDNNSMNTNFQVVERYTDENGRYYSSNNNEVLGLVVSEEQHNFLNKFIETPLNEFQRLNVRLLRKNSKKIKIDLLERHPFLDQFDKIKTF